MKKKEIFYVVILLLLSFTWIILQKSNVFFAQRVVVYLGKSRYGSYPLEENQIIKINEHNTLEIKDGSVRMKEADCPDGLCVKQGFVNKGGDSIVCLPNEVVITLEKTEEALDGVVR